MTWTRLRDGVLAALLVTGAIGVARQRAEAARVARGELEPATAAAQLPPPRQDRVSAWLSAWQPARPRTAGGRAIALAWAAPLTAVGLLAATAGAARLAVDRDRGCVVATGMRGPVRAVMGALGFDANAMGHVVLCRHAQPAAVLLDHEAAHVRQAERLGPLLLGVYVTLSARYGYRHNPLERAARTAAAERIGLR